MNRSSPRRHGVIDLGSNTSRLVVFVFQPGSWYRMIDQIREPIRLGRGMGNGGALSEGAIERAFAALKLFADYSAASDLDSVEVIATSAVREAANRKGLLARIATLEVDLAVLSGREEARLGALAVANGFALDDAWILDVGGGSAQLSRLEGRRFRDGISLPLGAVRLTEAHLTSDPPTTSQVRDLEKDLAKRLGPSLAQLAGDDRPLVAMGGTIRNLARSVQRHGKYPMSFLHGFRLHRMDLEELTARLLTRTARQRGRLAGINPDRGDIIAAGALFYRWILRETGREEILISGHGVREGRFFERFLPAPHLLEDVRAFSVASLSRQVPEGRAHSLRVCRLARRLFEGLEPLHAMGRAEIEILDAACLVHDIGMKVDYHRHHRHGAYLLGAAPLSGFSHREQALIMQLVRYHRAGLPRPGAFASLLVAGDQQRLLQLATCLRLAESLERSRVGRVENLKIKIGNKKARVRLVASEDPLIERWESAKHASLFAKAFGRKLVLE